MKIVIGISAYYHDSAAALIIDGEIIAAAQEERFTREKHDSSFPTKAISYCLSEANCTLQKVDYICFYDKPKKKFNRIIETYLAYPFKGGRTFFKAIPAWIFGKRALKKDINIKLRHIEGSGEIDFLDKILFTEHHFSHAASAFYPSPFQEAAVLTLDGVGEWATTTLAIGKGKDLEITDEIHFPHSLGLLYSAFTFYSGFKVNSGEYKLMGLAPYGIPKYSKLIKKYLIDVKDDGSFSLDMSYFDYCVGQTMTTDRFHKLFGGEPREPESTITQKEMDLAASIQEVTEEVVVKLAKGIALRTGQKNLCLAGGVALNCVANGKLLNEKIFENIWIQPASGDAGGALGAALAIYHIFLGKDRQQTTDMDGMKGSYLGPKYEQWDVEQRLERIDAVFEIKNEGELIDSVVTALAEGKAIGWHQGRMEFGPRALGARSIIADPRQATTQKLLNLKVKFRESFRPFAPSVLREDLAEWFNLGEDSPYMLFVQNVAKSMQVDLQEGDSKLFGIEKLNVPRSLIPAVTHVDYSARIQTVHSSTNRKYHTLISKFKELTGCPILVNTSFNVRSEPIVATPEDAFRCFMGTDIEILVIENCFLEKKKQKVDKKNYFKDFDLD